MKKFKSNPFENLVAIIIFLSIVGLFFYFDDLVNPNLTQVDPFRTYNNNPGIIIISVFSFTVRIIFIICFLLLSIDKFKYDKKILIIYIITALTIGFLQWFELYYGSTFYYGEVRDKHGLIFPVLASLMVTLVIWKINYSKTKNRNLTIKLILTGLFNFGLYFLWTQVYETWNLWQS